MKKSSLRWMLFLIPLIVLAPFINNFIYPKESTFSDLSITFYPNALYVHNLCSNTIHSRFGRMPS